VASLTGLPIVGSAFVPRGTILRTNFNGYDTIVYHRWLSVTGKKRKPHGRTNGPRRWKIKMRYIDDPAMAALLAEGGSGS
jgi:hypothetical protein